MSRIGKMPIPVPKGVEVKTDGSEIRVKGPKGELKRTFDPAITVALDDGILTVSRSSDNKDVRALHGLTRSLLANMVVGVSEGYQKELEIVGVGYRAQSSSGGKVSFQLGFSHVKEIDPPVGVSVIVKEPQRLVVEGIDKEQVGDVAAKIRGMKPPDHYKGKGVRYANEKVRIKPGKAGKAGAKR
jgi:large subunit ribosomal protein L6